MGPENIVYDPMEMQIRQLDRMLDARGLSVTKLAKNPQAIQLLIQQQALLLHELRDNKTKLENSDLAQEDLRNEREELRIALARLDEKHKVSIVEIPVSFATGFAINMLTTDSTSLVGWLLLMISFILLLFLRSAQVFSLFRIKNLKESK